MLEIRLETVRLFLHITAAAVWVGGQVVLGGLVPALRRAGHETVVVAARQFQRIAWPAFAVVLITGGWNLAEADLNHRADNYLGSLLFKLVAVILSGVCAGLHALVTGPHATAMRASGDDHAIRRARVWSGVLGAGGLLFGLVAMLVGVQLRTGI